MSQEERTGARDLTYSAWHRVNSISRFIGEQQAQSLALIDVDEAMWMECEDGTFEPIALIELARDIGQPSKTALATRNLARRCHPILPAYTVLYHVSTRANPCAPGYYDIDFFRVRQLWPDESKFFVVGPAEWAQKLLSIRAYGTRLLQQAG